MNKKSIFLSIFLLVIIGFLYYQLTTAPSGNKQLSSLVAPTPDNVLGEQTKTSDCVSINGMPDKECTPGAVFENVTKTDICKPGYAKSVRNVPISEKAQVYKEYGITSHNPGEYEVDHMISLELGGSNDITNLWPEPAKPQPGFHEKDLVENYLHDQVCNGKIPLYQAQMEITNNWLQVYKTLTQ